jgi:hypothetical protein
MQQSLWVSLDAYQLVNYALGSWTDFEHRSATGKILPGAAIVAANAVLMVVPLGMAWQHEQWHQAVLSSRRIESSVERNRVTGVRDEDLALLKREHPAEFVRHQTAGIEGGYEFVTTLEKQQYWFASLQQFFNYEHWFPGVAAQLYRYPFRITGDRSLSVSAMGNLWLQPEGQRFLTSRPQLGGMLRVRLDLSGPHTLEPFLEVDAKTSGWVAGIAALEPSLSLRLGVGMPLY